MQLIVDTPSLKEGNGRELRKLHDAIQQHVRALGNLGCELPGKFITSMIELKLDVDTLFEWQKAETSVPHYQALLDFIDMRAQALEVSCATHKTVKRPPSRVTSHATHSHHDKNCVACKIDKHPLYVCPAFRSMSQDSKMQVLKIVYKLSKWWPFQAPMQIRAQMQGMSEISSHSVTRQ